MLPPVGLALEGASFRVFEVISGAEFWDNGQGSFGSGPPP